MASPVGSACTNVVYKQPNAGTTVSQHAARFTATFPAGSSIAYVPVGPLAADDLILMEQRAQMDAADGLPFAPSRSLQVNDPMSGYAEFVTMDNQNTSVDVDFAFSVLRNA